MALIDVFNLRHQAEFRARLIGAGALAHTGNADLFKADVSNLATSSQVSDVCSEVQKLTDMTQTTGNPVYRRFKYNDPAWVWMRFRQ